MRYITPAQAEAERAAYSPTVHPSLRQPHVDPVSSPLHVITVVSNPMRWASRYRLYEAFAKQCEDAGAVLWTVELATRDRHFQVTEDGNPHHIQLRSASTLWHKENMINVALRHLPMDARYIAWVDADVTFLNREWAAETVHQLQVHPVVQMFSHAQELDPDGTPYIFKTGIAYDWNLDRHTLQRDGIQEAAGPSGYQPYKDRKGHSKSGRHGYETPADDRPGPWGQMLFTGYAWAARREVLDGLGGLGEMAILGSGDHHMGWALIGQVERSLPVLGLHPSYAEYWLHWEHRARKHVRGQLGSVKGTVVHHFHGHKNRRFYLPRWEILRRHQFDWRLDVTHDSQGLLIWTGDKPDLEADTLNYFAIRDEDATS